MRLGLLLGLGLALLPACVAAKEPTPAPATPAKVRGAPIAYDFESLDEHPVSFEGLKGRATAIVFITTYGDASIVQARFLKKVFREFVPRINAAAVFMERADNRPLARIFRDQVGLPYPLAMADSQTISGQGPFAGIGTVPSVVVLDPEGREVWRKTGVAHPDELVKALKDAQSGVWGDR